MRPSVPRVLARSTGRFSAALRPRWREVTARRARAARSGTDALRVATCEQGTNMDLPTLVAQWSGKLPEGFVSPAILQTSAPECSLKRCRRPAAVKKDGTFAHACAPCLARRAASCRRRRAALSAEGGCRRCAYRKRLEGDFLCERCREDRNIKRARKRQDAIDAAAIDEFAAQPERVHKASNLDIGVSPWNARRKPPEPSAGYWSPLPDPEPREEREWARPLFDDGWRYRRC